MVGGEEEDDLPVPRTQSRVPVGTVMKCVDT